MSEHHLQSAYFDAVRLTWPHLKLIYAVPNAGGYRGGFRSNAGRVAKMLKEGLTPGIPDVNIDVAAHGFNGFRIEFKMPGNTPTANQKEAHSQLKRAGYLVEIHNDWQQAFERTKWYLSGVTTKATA